MQKRGADRHVLGVPTNELKQPMVVGGPRVVVAGRQRVQGDQRGDDAEGIERNVTIDTLTPGPVETRERRLRPGRRRGTAWSRNQQLLDTPVVDRRGLSDTLSLWGDRKISYRAFDCALADTAARLEAHVDRYFLLHGGHSPAPRRFNLGAP